MTTSSTPAELLALADRIDTHLALKESSPGFHLSDNDFELIAVALRGKPERDDLRKLEPVALTLVDKASTDVIRRFVKQTEDNPALRAHTARYNQLLSIIDRLVAAPPVPSAPQCAEPVAWRWRALGMVNWVYDPTPEWREDHKGDDEIEIRPLYAYPPAAPVLPVEVGSDDAEAGDGTWQELIELATRARARAHHHFLNSKTHDLFIECAERLEALAPTTASPISSADRGGET